MSNVINASASAAYNYQSTYTSVTKTENGKESSLSAIYESLEVSASVTLDLSSTGDEKTTKIDTDKVKAIKEDFGRHLDAFKQMVLKLFDNQGAVGNVAMNNLRDLLGRIEKAGGIDELSQAQAQEMISEDGYWGVEKTSQRILDFAKAISGGDASKIDQLKDAFQKGYDKAASLWGGELPEISKQTYDKVMEGFADWAASMNTAEDSGEE